MDILISESKKGIHANIAKMIGARMMAFTYRPNIQCTQTHIEDMYYDIDIPIGSNEQWFYVENMTNPYRMLVDVYGKNIIKMIIGLLKQGGGHKIYLSHDLDVAGQLMASLLHYHLVKEGVPRDLIIRLALADIEYMNLDLDTGQLTSESMAYLTVGFGEFYTDSQLYAVLETIRTEEQLVSGWTKTRAGYRKMFSMAHIEAKRSDTEYRIEKQNSGTNYATYVTNVAIHYRAEYNKQMQERNKILRIKRKMSN